MINKFDNYHLYIPYLITNEYFLLLIYFTIFSTIRENCKRSISLTELISEHSSRTQLTVIKTIVEDNINICEDIRHELNRISFFVNFDGTQVSRDSNECVTVASKMTDLRLSSDVIVEGSNPDDCVTRVSKPPRRSGRRQSEPITKLPEQRPSRRSVPGTKITAKQEEFQNDLTAYRKNSHTKNILFRGMREGNICKICISTDNKNDGDLMKCSGACGDHVHSTCVFDINNASSVNISLLPEQNTKPSIKVKVTADLFCNECYHLSSSICYACKEACSSPRNHCSLKSCGRYYHTECLDDWNQSKFTASNKMICPLHVCHTCVSDDPDNNQNTRATSKLTRCVKCPTTYHINSCCIPAGTIILTQNKHICIRHRSESKMTRKSVSLDWCFVCGEEGK